MKFSRSYNQTPSHIPKKAYQEKSEVLSLMKIHGVKREWSHPIFCMKKHYCPYCNELLEKTKTETVVNSKSEEAKNYDFSQPGGDGNMMGNIKFIRIVFRCNKCDKTYTIKEVKENDIAINRWK